MKAYKHVKARYADEFADGSAINLGTFASYRDSESARGDPHEGKFGYRVDNRNRQTPYFHDRTRQALQLLGGPNPSSLNNVLLWDNVVRFVVPDRYIFCASVSEETINLGGEEALFEISDLELFAHRISACCVNFLPWRWQIGVVRYDEVLADFYERDAHFDPFLKAITFKEELEIRIVWAPERTPDRNIIVNAPKVSRLIKRLR